MIRPVKHVSVFSFWEVWGLLFFLFLGFSLLLFYFKGMGFPLTQKGIKLLRDKKFLQAQKQFEQALAKNPTNPWPYLNLALSYDLSNKPDKALKNYDIISSLLKTTSNRAVFFSLFNKGELNGRLNQTDKALENYQKALDFHYKEKEIKTNIELLFQNNPPEPEKSQPDKKGKSKSEGQKEEKNENQKKSAEENNSASEEKNQPSQPKNTPAEDRSKENEKQKGLSEAEQKAVLEEIEKQESKTRARFYEMKKIFGDKTQKDW